jgi:flagellar FliL protein
VKQLPKEQNQEAPAKKGLPAMLITIIITAVVAAGVSFLVIMTLGSNLVSPEPQKQEQQTIVPADIKAVLIQPGSMYTFMLKGGKSVVVVDSLSFKVGSDQCRASIAEKKDEILDAIQQIFLRKESTELGTAAGIELLKMQVKDAVNQITGFIGEKEKFGVVNVFMYIKAISSVE